MSSGGNADTVGSLLASIATCLTEALRILMFADKRQWGPDEFEQIRALEEALDEAKEDYQEMSPLVHGQFYYQNDRSSMSIHELRNLHAKFEFHAQNFKDWARQGGPINPTWARETAELKRDLHRAQCRAAGRIFAAEQEGARCLGAFQVYRQQKRLEAERQRRRHDHDEQPLWQQQQQQQTAENGETQYRGERPDDPRRRSSLEELVPSCNAVGRFERLGDLDAAFVCDFCDGFIVWPNLRGMPAARTITTPPPQAPDTSNDSASSAYPHWQAMGQSRSTGADKTVVFAPVAIANHVAPGLGAWQAGILCPYCDEYTYLDQSEDSEEDVRYAQDEKGFPDLAAFQAHLEWYHTALAMPAMSPLASALPSSVSGCRVM
ncbi:hypothetical protein B0T26DRAFT_637839 [Lasiosphaeria miniovina]|uniref:Uncharacterized protein n=1 Tax=Lasiosphaeria miniovina TaxID=1954250 RepID=A0AA40B5G9_9PEZI|nr:uncharacterized protein B0T26DRAFT_637839 [Lasiosphaeria miniovina]KAK0727978.1 hypothetical protein B0T26DRAFT_637839 [Lasiosphaeria miniovina]